MMLGNCRHAEDVSSSACPQFQVLVKGLGLSDGEIVSGGQWMAEDREGRKTEVGEFFL